MSRGDWMETRETLRMSTIQFQHHSSVHISLSDFERFSTESFPLNVSKRRSSWTFPSESFPQKVLLRRFLQGCFFFFFFRRFPIEGSPTCFPQKVLLRNSSWKLPLRRFLQKFPLVVSIRSFPKMFPLKGSLQKFSLRRFP